MEEEVGHWVKIKKILVAPKGKFRVVAVDTFEPPGEGHTIIGDYDSLKEAKRRLKDSTPDTPYYIYDDKGNEVSGKDEKIRQELEMYRREGKTDAEIQKILIEKLKEKRRREWEKEKPEILKRLAKETRR